MVRKSSETFLDGLLELEESIKRDLDNYKNGRPTNPFINVPESLRTTESIGFCDNLREATNQRSIFNLFLGDISVLTDKDSMLKSILKNDISNNPNGFSDEAKGLVYNTYALMDYTLCNELYKEITDAYYLIINHLSNDIARLIVEVYKDYDLDAISREIFYELTDDNIAQYIKLSINDSQLYRKAQDTYMLYNYTFLLRQRILVKVSANTYEKVRELLYDMNINTTTNFDLYDTCYNSLVFDYMYIFDNMVNLLSVAFQSKIASCYNNIDEFIRCIKENEIVEIECDKKGNEIGRKITKNIDGDEVVIHQF